MLENTRLYLVRLAPLFVLEAIFLATNLVKIRVGGSIPVGFAIVIMLVMWTWTKGSRYLKGRSPKNLSECFRRLDITFGFMEEPNVTRALTLCKKKGFKFEIMQTSFYLGRRNLIATPNTGLPRLIPPHCQIPQARRWQ